MGMHSILGLVPQHGARAVRDVIGDFLAAMRGQAVHHQYVGVAAGFEQCVVDLVGGEDQATLGGLGLLAGVVAAVLTGPWGLCGARASGWAGRRRRPRPSTGPRSG